MFLELPASQLTPAEQHYFKDWSADFEGNPNFKPAIGMPASRLEDFKLHKEWATWLRSVYFEAVQAPFKTTHELCRTFLGLARKPGSRWDLEKAGLQCLLLSDE